MEAEQEMEKEMKMVLHCPPTYPLPEEIKKVGSDSVIMLLKTQARHLADFVFEIMSEHQETSLLGKAVFSMCIRFWPMLYIFPFNPTQRPYWHSICCPSFLLLLFIWQTWNINALKRHLFHPGVCQHCTLSICCSNPYDLNKKWDDDSSFNLPSVLRYAHKM